MMPYLLQVWTSNGDMVFEKSLRQPISNWNISGDKFLFQESKDSEYVHIVKLFLDEQPYLFRFKLPLEDQSHRKNSYYDPDLERIVIPAEEGLNEKGGEEMMRSRTKDYNYMVRMGEMDSMYKMKST